LRYADDAAQVEVRLGRYRIDVVAGDELIEIQHGSLAAIRDKIGALVKQHDVRVVKPIIARKTLIKRRKAGGRVVERRLSPKRGTLVELFDELIYFRRVFPHPRLTLEALLVDVEEDRHPGHGRRRRWRRRDHVVSDQRLVAVHEARVLRTAADLRRLVDCSLPDVFHTGHLAEGLGIPRWIAQRIAYCFRHMGTTEQVGKLRNAALYRFVHDSPRRAA
jgi:hypothetical protein